jgi:hypothetical protein
MKMNKDITIEIFQTFSEIHNFEYNCDSLPYIPFGGMKGAVQDSIFYLYVRRIESDVEGSFHTVFGISNYNILPKGFCIEKAGGPNRIGKPFKDRISILGHDDELVYKTIKNEIESQVVQYFDEVDKLDASIFKNRSALRISEDGITLIVGKLFQNIDELKSAYAAVIKLLMGLEKIFLKNSNQCVEQTA